MYKLILLDLDGTLLRSDKTISRRSLAAVDACRKAGAAIAAATARGLSSAEGYLRLLRPDGVISSDGALVTWGDEVVFSRPFSPEETVRLLRLGFSLTGGCEATVDTADGYYWNTWEDVSLRYPGCGEVRRTDYSDFHEAGLKICLELPEEAMARQVGETMDCHWAGFTGGNWYKFTKKGVGKETALPALERRLGVSRKETAAFGDDAVDAGLLRRCGLGVAVGNAVEAAKRAADRVAPSNDEDGVAAVLEDLLARGLIG